MHKMLCFSMLILFSACAAEFNYTYRLPEDILPTHYTINLTLTSDPGYNVLSRSQIDFTCQRDTNELVFHANPDFLEINSIFDVKHQKYVQMVNCRQDDSKMIVECRLENKLLQNQNYSFRFEFTIFKINYVPATPDGVKGLQWIILDSGDAMFYTIFQMLGARRVFPCLDEPKFKAKFSLTLELHKAWSEDPNIVAVSNTELIERNENKWTFEETPRMSTYLLAFAVGKFVRSCFAQPGTVTSCSNFNPVHINEYSSEIYKLHLEAISFHSFMQNYLDTDNEERLEVVYLDSFDGAMEHWGLIAMSIDSLDDIDETSQILRHEITHYWFGNLVTPQSWADFWISEGITQFFTDFVDHKTGTIGNAMQAKTSFTLYLQFVDQNGFLPAVVNETWANDYDAEEKLILACYYKASMIIQMLVQLLDGDGGHSFCSKGKHFQNILRSIVDKYRYSSLNTSAFVEQIEQEFICQDNWNQWPDMKEFMHSWLYQQGYPTITVTKDQESEMFTIEQTGAHGQIWYVPIWSFDEKSQETKVWYLTQKKQTINFYDFYGNGSVKVSWNKNEFGYYNLIDQTGEGEDETDTTEDIFDFIANAFDKVVSLFDD